MLNLWFNIILPKSDPSSGNYAWNFLPLMWILWKSSLFASFFCFLSFFFLLIYFYFPFCRYFNPQAIFENKFQPLMRCFKRWEICGDLKSQHCMCNGPVLFFYFNPLGLRLTANMWKCIRSLAHSEIDWRVISKNCLALMRTSLGRRPWTSVWSLVILGMY